MSTAKVYTEKVWANSVDPDQTVSKEQSDEDLLCLLNIQKIVK